MENGWVIGLLVTGEAFPYALFAVAEADQERAVAIIAEATAETRGANDVVEIAGPISKRFLESCGLTATGDYCALS
ncbi:MAG: hypothetical protein INR64_13925 [Caulobacteraceae bacterium]|nr:hypothetical protein [Caulobacter sp.]